MTKKLMVVSTMVLIRRDRIDGLPKTRGYWRYREPIHDRLEKSGLCCKLRAAYP